MRYDPCKRCGGSGKIVTEKGGSFDGRAKACPDCGGDGRARPHKNQTPVAPLILKDIPPDWAKTIIFKLDKIMIDTSKILAAVAQENTELKSWEALVDGLTATMKDLSTQLAAAIVANDPAALAQVQADLDKAAADLSADNQEATAAITANTPTTP